jgi:predicted O-methyltransferase YrrM
MIYEDDYPSFGSDDSEALRTLVRSVLKPDCKILEIGSWLGSGSTRVIIEELRTVDAGRLYCVDTWKGSKNVARHLDIVARYDVFGTFLHNVRLADGETIVRPLPMSSNDAAAIVADGCLDMVFIDGDHSYASTSQDISLGQSKVRLGGILCGHDCECRPTGTLRDAIYSSRDMDHIPGDGTPFSVIHPGVVVAVDEAFAGSAHLWSEVPLPRADGTFGRATLWNVLQSPPGRRK